MSNAILPQALRAVANSWNKMPEAASKAGAAVMPEGSSVGTAGPHARFGGAGCAPYLTWHSGPDVVK
jgi:hypothetical protein